MTKPLTPAEQEELNRIGAETVTLSSATGQELGAFQGLGEASKGILSPSASAATALGTALSAPAVLWDYGKSIATGKQTTEAGDWMFKNVVDPYGRDVEKYWRPDPNAMGSASQTASGAFQLAGMVPQFFAHPAIPLSGMTISPTMDAVDQGVSTEGVYKIGALNLVTNGVGFALPAAWGKTMVSRMGTGIASNVVLGAAQREGTGAVLAGENNPNASAYRWNDMEAMLFDAGVGGIFAGKLHYDAINDPTRHKLSPEQQQAVYAEVVNDHFKNQTLPGMPMNNDGMKQHTTALDAAIGQILRGERVDVSAAIDLNNFLIRPELRPQDYAPRSSTGQAVGNYGAGFLMDAAVYDNFSQFRVALESAGNPNAKAATSSATGLHQFTEGTWLNLVKQNKPAWAKGLSESQVLALRTDPEISTDMVRLLDQQNFKMLANDGLPVNFHTMYAMHHFSPASGKAFAKAEGDTAMADILRPAELDANPYLKGKTKDQAIANWQKRAAKAGAPVETLFTKTVPAEPADARPIASEPVQGDNYPNGVPRNLPEVDSVELQAINSEFSRVAKTGPDGTVESHRGVRAIDEGSLPNELAQALRATDEALGVKTSIVRNLSPEIRDFHGVTLGDSRIYINENSPHPVVTVAIHEFSHNLETQAPDLYKPLLSEVKRQGKVDAFRADTKTKGRGTAARELTNNAIGDALSDPKFLRRMAKENPTVFQRVAETVMEYLDKLLSKVGYGSDKYLTDVAKFRDMLATQLNEYVARNGGEQGKQALLFSDKLDDTYREPMDIPDMPDPVEAPDPAVMLEMPEVDRVADAKRRAELQAAHDKQLQLRQKALSIVAMEKVRRDIDAFPGKPLDALERIVARVYDAKGNIQSVESKAKAVTADAVRQMTATLTATNPKMFGFMENEQGVLDLVNELHGTDTGNPDAKAGAKAFAKVANSLKTRFNRAGGDIGELEDWAMPHSHSQLKAALAGKEKWIADITPKLNRDRYPMNDAELRNLLERAWETIATNGINKQTPGQFKGPGKVANRGSEARQLHFKDGQAYVEYQKQYGEHGPAETLVNHIQGMAHDIAMIETFGPNPDNAFATLKDEAIQKQVLADPAGESKATEKGRWLDTLYREVSGKAKPVASYKLAAGFDAWRSLQVASKLGSAAITALTDHGTMHTSAMAAGLPQMKLLANELAAFDPTNMTERNRVERMGLGLATMMGELNRFGADVGIASDLGMIGKVAKGLNRTATATMKASGLMRSTDARRRAYGVTMMDTIGSLTKQHKTLADLDPTDNRILLSKGITEQDFQVWKLAELETLGANHSVLTPDAIYAIPDAKLAKLTDAIGEAVEPDVVRQQAVTKLLGSVLEEVDIAVIEPGAKERAMMQRNRVRGTWTGEIMSSLFLFKSFPISMITKHWARMAGTPGGLNKAQYGVALTASTTLLGMMSMQLANMLQGKDPRDMTDAATWVQALLKGGGLSLFGDYLLQDQTQNGNTFVESLVGPFGSTLGDVYGMTVGNMHEAAQGKDTHMGAELVKFGKNNTPMANLWYTRAATDHLIVNELQEMASPGYLRKVEKRARKEYGDTYFWRPGETTPERLPNMDKAVGE